jgi:threonine/homoserine/homoserine lactone efflux protein
MTALGFLSHDGKGESSMTDRSRFIPLFILSAMITICPATVLFGMTVFPTSSAPTRGSLLLIVLVLISLLTILIISGLWGDLIRGTTERPDGMRDVRVLATIGGGILAGVLMAITVGGFCFWLATMLPWE